MSIEIERKRMYRDTVIKLAKLNKTHTELAEELKIGRSTIWRLKKDKEISTTNFFKIIEWLDNGIEKYIIRDKKKAV